MSKKETELKPCPFCGGEPVMRGLEFHWVTCRGCASEGVMGTEEEAIAGWNKRKEQK